MSLGEMTNQLGAKKGRKRWKIDKDRTKNERRRFSTKLNPISSMYFTEHPEAPDIPAELEKDLSERHDIHR